MSLTLNAGVPATGPARRAGHSVVVLLKIYAQCIDGQADVANKRIADALALPVLAVIVHRSRRRAGSVLSMLPHPRRRASR